MGKGLFSKVGRGGINDIILIALVLVGGGLIGSVGGWSSLKGYRRSGTRVKGDERILGSSDFVERVLREAEEDFEQKIRLQANGPDLQTLIKRVANYYEIDSETLKTSSKARQIARARVVLCYLAVRKLMCSCAKVARSMDISPSAVSKAVIKGQAIPNLRQIQKDLLGV